MRAAPPLPAPISTPSSGAGGTSAGSGTQGAGGGDPTPPSRKTAAELFREGEAANEMNYYLESQGLIDPNQPSEFVEWALRDPLPGAGDKLGFEATAATGLALAGGRGERLTIRGDGTVYFRAPPGAPAEEIAQVQAYIQGSNEALVAGYLSPSGRVSTSGQLRVDANRAAAVERSAAAARGQPYGDLHAGHVPDTTWTGKPEPFKWLPLSPRVNSSLGGQAAAYPVGFKPTGFAFEPAVPRLILTTGSN